MTESNPVPTNSVLLIGGPDAGKSNYLFRLWIALNDGRCTLTNDGLPSDVAYLRSGAERLLGGEFAGRTSKEVHERVEMPVKSSAPGVQTRRGILVVPDMPGEQILTVYRNRQWSHTWEEHISSRCGSLFFIRAGSSENVVSLDWATCIDIYGSAILAPSSPSTEVNSEIALRSAQTRTNPERQPAREHADLKDGEANNGPPTQVLLTEWMQFLRRAIADHAGGAHRPRVGVVVSAWDAVPNDQVADGPMSYLKHNFPLLHQFIESNEDHFELQVFGLSVVSGDLNDDTEFQMAYEAGNPRDFGYVMHSLEGELRKDPDITLPVAWSLGFVDARLQ